MERFENDEWELVRHFDSPAQFGFNLYRKNEGGFWDLKPTYDGAQIAGFKIILSFQRRALYYEFNLLAPVVLLTIIEFFVTFLSSSEEKLNLEVTLLLGFLFMQTIVSQIIPQSVVQPRIAWYILGSLMYCCFNVLGESIINAACSCNYHLNFSKRIFYILIEIPFYILHPFNLIGLVYKTGKKIATRYKNKEEEIPNVSITRISRRTDMFGIENCSYQNKEISNTGTEISIINYQSSGNPNQSETNNNIDANQEKVESSITWERLLENLKAILRWIRVILSILLALIFLLPLLVEKGKTQSFEHEYK